MQGTRPPAWVRVRSEGRGARRGEGPWAVAASVRTLILPPPPPTCHHPPTCGGGLLNRTAGGGQVGRLVTAHRQLAQGHFDLQPRRRHPTCDVSRQVGWAAGQRREGGRRRRVGGARRRRRPAGSTFCAGLGGSITSVVALAQLLLRGRSRSRLACRDRTAMDRAAAPAPRAATALMHMLVSV